MSRPKRCCRIYGEPVCRAFHPTGRPCDAVCAPEQVVLALEELEALRLSDMEGLYHEAAAQQMGVSRATFGRVLQEGRAKVATALVRGMALTIDGGNYEMSDQTGHKCCGGKGHAAKANETAAAEGSCGCGGKGQGHGHGQGKHAGGECLNTAKPEGHTCCRTKKPA
jgi:uncharacterized protein